MDDGSMMSVMDTPSAEAMAQAVATVQLPVRSTALTVESANPANLDNDRVDSPRSPRRLRTRLVDSIATDYIVATCISVNNCATKNSNSVQIGAMDSDLSHRLKLVSASFDSAREWCRKAKEWGEPREIKISLTEVSAFYDREKKWLAAREQGLGADSKRPSIGAEKLAALAHVAGVSFEWLATGTGDRFTGSAAKQARYQNLENVITRSAGEWEPGAIAQVRSMQLDAEEDPDEEWWAAQLHNFSKALRIAAIGIPKLPNRGVDPLAGLKKR